MLAIPMVGLYELGILLVGSHRKAPTHAEVAG
jgi:Sec-independent protein secretion pathway component TatC